jgi:hypothetical protein
MRFRGSASYLTMYVLASWRGSVGACSWPTAYLAMAISLSPLRELEVIVAGAFSSALVQRPLPPRRLCRVGGGGTHPTHTTLAISAPLPFVPGPGATPPPPQLAARFPQAEVTLAPLKPVSRTMEKVRAYADRR